jgi:hypothetical protein
MHERWLVKRTIIRRSRLFQDYLEAINAPQVRLAALEQQLHETVPTWTMGGRSWRPTKPCRGLSFLVAITFVAEVGDARRFATPQQLMAFLRPRCVGTHDRGHGAARLHYEDRQSSSTTGARRGSVDIPISARVGETLRVDSRISPLASAASPGRHRDVRPLPSAHCQWEEDPCCDNGGCSERSTGAHCSQPVLATAIFLSLR